jgi:hypothetical protein
MKGAAGLFVDRKSDVPTEIEPLAVHVLAPAGE